MERIDIDGESCLVGYHTQERRADLLVAPIPCKAKDAWLGIGMYFWTDEEFARYWGEDTKVRKTGSYTIYKAELVSTKQLNATFEEEHYFFFVSCIEKARMHFSKRGITPTLEQVHRFMADRFWPGKVDSIIFDDIPWNPIGKSRVHSTLLPLYYKKRIQVVVFNYSLVRNFRPHLDRQT